MPAALPAGRCGAAHPDDPTPCGGPAAVTIADSHGAVVGGCEHHAARMLASLDGARVAPLPAGPAGAAVRVFTAADTLRPFCWIDGPLTLPSQLSRAENRDRDRR
ncbi:hypothetical protein ABZX85_32930 [Streptomyces sp. NPDC004539]|uniref:hypothetical protein n=1 Tax=Streptomyces sp. NPDC004539 TaxID=3154280 RepID=UPI0033B996CB